MTLSPQLVLFIVFSIVAIYAAFGVVTTENVVHSALSLVVAVSAVAGIFFVLYADFLGLVQILIYGGAVAMLVLFALMLTRGGGGLANLDNRQKPWALVVAGVTLAVILFVAISAAWPAQQVLQRVSIQQLGRSLFLQWAVPFELVSLVLLVALIGAIVIARQEE
ncbi:MAG TPA: NADH-quinone oxidoreductase subunit J [Dehalococcoidia bacterium]|nr:NADH-quinone oxidoreductase subunit J [Dehalococcoidia bacterium]